MNSKDLFISVVIPVFNESTRLVRCLESIKNQTHKNFEVIVVDNNSTDNTAKLATGYKFVRVIKEPKQGIVYARNTGFRAARAGIIARIDADTILPEDWLARVNHYAIRRGEDKAWAITGSGEFYNTAFTKSHAVLHSFVYYYVNRLLLGYYPLWGSNMVITKTAWDLVKNDICFDDKIHEDMDLSAHLYAHNIPIYFIYSLKTKMELKRVDGDPKKLWHYLMRWIYSLKKHNKLAGYLGYPIMAIVFIFGITVGAFLVDINELKTSTGLVFRKIFRSDI